MSFINRIHIETAKQNPFPYNIPAIKYAKHLDMSAKINFLVGDNGTGKSTLLETLAFRLQLPHMDGSGYSKKAFQAAVKLAEELEIDFNIERTKGFFFRAEDFGDYLNSVERTDARSYLRSLEGEVSDSIIQEMLANANDQLYHMRKNYGQDLNTFSHGEAYLKIMNDKLERDGIYLLDEPEAALSPAKQLSLIYQIMNHLQSNMSQFIIATHSPMLLAIPGAHIYEITDNSMALTELEDTEHYRITKSFLNDPQMYLRHLG